MPHTPTPADVQRALLRQIDAERTKREMTQQDLADAIGVTRETLGRQLGGKHKMTLDLLMRISEALDVPVLSLLSDAEKFAKHEANKRK